MFIYTHQRQLLEPVLGSASLRRSCSSRSDQLCNWSSLTSSGLHLTYSSSSHIACVDGTRAVRACCHLWVTRHFYPGPYTTRNDGTLAVHRCLPESQVLQNQTNSPRRDPVKQHSPQCGPLCIIILAHLPHGILALVFLMTNSLVIMLHINRRRTKFIRTHSQLAAGLTQIRFPVYAPVYPAHRDNVFCQMWINTINQNTQLIIFTFTRHDFCSLLDRPRTAHFLLRFVHLNMLQPQLDNAKITFITI